MKTVKYYAVYLCGDDYPTAIFVEKKDAKKWLKQFDDEEYHSMDRTIKPIKLRVKNIERTFFV